MGIYLEYIMGCCDKLATTGYAYSIFDLYWGAGRAFAARLNVGAEQCG